MYYNKPLLEQKIRDQIGTLVMVGHREWSLSQVLSVGRTYIVYLYSSVYTVKHMTVLDKVRQLETSVVVASGL